MNIVSIEGNLDYFLNEGLQGSKMIYVHTIGKSQTFGQTLRTKHHVRAQRDGQGLFQMTDPLVQKVI